MRKADTLRLKLAELTRLRDAYAAQSKFHLVRFLDNEIKLTRAALSAAEQKPDL